MATYRPLQSDFSGGQLDPMVESNMNNSLRSIGLKTSRNTLHYQNGSVGKRPPFRDCCQIVGTSYYPNLVYTYRNANATMLIDGYTVDIQITPSEYFLNVGVTWKGVSYSSVEIETEDESVLPRGTKTSNFTFRSMCVYKEFLLILITVTRNDGGDDYSVILTVKVTQDSTKTCGLKFLAPSDVNSNTSSSDEEYPGWNAGTVYDCMFLAGGRLILAEGNGLFLSRTRTLALKETDDSGAPSWLYDFTLAEYSYTFKATRSGGIITVDGLSSTVEETFECESSSEPSDTITLDQAKQYQTKRTTRFTISGNWPTSETPAASQTVITYIENGYSGSGVVSFSSVRLVDSVEYLTTPDEAPSPDKVTWPSDTLTVDTEEMVDSPTVYDTHAIELHENDMYSSRIRWISYVGRVIVGTDQAIFIATSQSITPALFDLVISANIGTSEIQPQVMSNLIIFTSADRKKLYAGVYSDELQNMQFTEASSSARDLFVGLISRFWILEYPFMMIYVVTEDGRFLVCTPTQSDSGYNFAWSEWEFLSERTGEKLYINQIFHDRGNIEETDADLKTPKIYTLASDTRVALDGGNGGDNHLLELLYTEPYEYGLTKDVKWTLDIKQEAIAGVNNKGLKIRIPDARSSVASVEGKYTCIIKWDTPNSDGTYQTETFNNLSPVAEFAGLNLTNLVGSSLNYGYGEHSTLDNLSFVVSPEYKKFIFRFTLPAQVIPIESLSYSDHISAYLSLSTKSGGNAVVASKPIDGKFTSEEPYTFTLAEETTITFVVDIENYTSKGSVIITPTISYAYFLVFPRKVSKAIINNMVAFGLTESDISILNQLGYSDNDSIAEFFKTYCASHPMAAGKKNLVLPSMITEKTEENLTNHYWYAMFALFGVTDSATIAQIVDSVTYEDGGYWFPFSLYADKITEINEDSAMLTIYPSAGQGSLFNPKRGTDETFTATIGVPYEMKIGLLQQLLPNNSGTALRSKHSIDRLQLQVFRSFGGSIYAKGSLVKDLLFLMYGKDAFSTGGIDPNTQLPYCFTGIVSVDNPVQNTEEDEIEIVSDTPYPFNLMAVSIKYNITEIN